MTKSFDYEMDFIRKTRDVGSKLWGVMADANLDPFQTIYLFEKMVATVIHQNVSEPLWDEAVMTFGKQVIDHLHDISKQNSTTH